MLKCKHIAEQASEYLESEQGFWQRWSWRMHLFICANCRRFVKNLQLTCQMAAVKKMPEASDQEVDDIMKKIASAESSSDRDA